MYNFTKGPQRPSNTEVLKRLGGYKLPWKYFLKAIYLLFRSTQILSKPSGVTAHAPRVKLCFNGQRPPHSSVEAPTALVFPQWASAEGSLLSEVYLLSSWLHFLKSDGKVTRVGVGSLDWSGSWHWPLFSLWPPGVTYSRSESLSLCSLTRVWGGWTNTCKTLCPASLWSCEEAGNFQVCGGSCGMFMLHLWKQPVDWVSSPVQERAKVGPQGTGPRAWEN